MPLDRLLQNPQLVVQVFVVFVLLDRLPQVKVLHAFAPERLHRGLDRLRGWLFARVLGLQFALFVVGEQRTDGRRPLQGQGGPLLGISLLLLAHSCRRRDGLLLAHLHRRRLRLLSLRPFHQHNVLLHLIVASQGEIGVVGERQHQVCLGDVKPAVIFGPVGGVEAGLAPAIGAGGPLARSPEIVCALRPARRLPAVGRGAAWVVGAELLGIVHHRHLYIGRIVGRRRSFLP